jgi:hypothetical protein
MSFAPATFTASVALVLTAAGAIGGQWMLDAQRSYAETAPRRAHEQQQAARAALEGFKTRTAAYATLHREVSRSLRARTQTNGSKSAAEREQALSKALIEARSGARAGECFGEFATPLRRIVRQEFTWQQGPADQAALFQDVPPDVSVDVNKAYPVALPSVTAPRTLLRVLPELPDVLEYRIAGRHLVLLDTRTQIVVDVLRNVFPA